MPKRQKAMPIRMRCVQSHETRWNADGTAESRSCRDGPIAEDAPWVRDPRLDFGMPMGDLIIDPWIQNALKKTE